MKFSVPLAIAKVAAASVVTGGVAIRARASASEPAAIKILLKNDTDRTVQVSFDGGSTYCLELLTNERVIIDDVKLSGDIWAKALVSAATTGNFIASVFIEG